MKSALLALALGLGACASNPAPVALAESASPNLTVVNAYFAALEATMHGAAGNADVERLLEFYADDVVYEHPRVGIHLEGKQAQRDGVTRFLSAYGGGPADADVEILSAVEAPGAVITVIRSRFLLQTEAGVSPQTRDQTRVLEFREGRISRVIDYW